MKTNVLRSLMAVSLAAGIVAAAAGAAPAAHGRVVAGGPADVRVWVDGGDVFPGYGDVTVWVRADRDCYTTLFLVDTAGFIHVLNPDRYADDGWIAGGRSYCYRACDLGLDRLDGHGIAYVFAVGSPVPFDYSYYGAGVFVGGFGYRVVGDPFVACREFYMPLLPAGCRWDFVGVGYTRFYVREWVRYPSYLCVGGPGFHVRIGDACRVCADAYASYRCSSAAPWDVIRPVPRFKEAYGDPASHPAVREQGSHEARVVRRVSDDDRAARGAIGSRAVERVEKRTAREIPSVVQQRVASRERVVSTDRDRERELARNAWKQSAPSREQVRREAVEAPSREKSRVRPVDPAVAQEKGKAKRARQAQ